LSARPWRRPPSGSAVSRPCPRHRGRDDQWPDLGLNDELVASDDAGVEHAILTAEIGRPGRSGAGRGAVDALHALRHRFAHVADAGHQYASLRRLVLSEVDALLDLREPLPAS